MTPRLDDARERFLDAAAKLFGELGFEGTSTDAIVARAGGSKATLYKLFPSKEDLLLGLVNRAGTDLARRGAAEGALDDRPRAWLTELARATIAQVLSPELTALYRLAIARTPHQPELGKTFFAAGPSLAHSALAKHLARAHARGLLDCPDPQRATSEFFGMLLFQPQMEILLGVRARLGRKELGRHVETCVTAFLAAHAPRKASVARVPPKHGAAGPARRSARGPRTKLARS